MNKYLKAIIFYAAEGRVGAKIASISPESSMYQEPLKYAFLLTSLLPLGINSKKKARTYTHTNKEAQKEKCIYTSRCLSQMICDGKHSNAQQ